MLRSTVFHPQNESLNDKKYFLKCFKSICFRIQKHIQDSNLPLDIKNMYLSVKCNPGGLSNQKLILPYQK